MYTTFRHELTDTYDIVRIDDLGLQTVVDGGKEPRFRSTDKPEIMYTATAMEEHISPSIGVDLLATSANAEEQQNDQDSTVPWLTWNAAIMALVTSIGGLLFGFDTGKHRTL